MRLYYENDGIFDKAEPETISDSYYTEIEELVQKLNGYGSEFCETASMVNQEVKRPEGVSDDDTRKNTK